MTYVMMATYPDVFAGGAPMAGPPYRCATSSMGGMSCMNGTVTKSASEWGNLVRNAYSGYSGPYPLVSIWQGSADGMVNKQNLTEGMKQWTNVHGTNQTANVSETFRTADHKVYNNSASQAVTETYLISGMDHGITVDPGNNTDQGGSTGSYSFDKNIYSSYYAALFWGLIDGNDGDDGDDGDDPPPPPPPACEQWTAKNSTHLTNGRAWASWGFYYATGSNQYLGYGSWSSTTVHLIDGTYYKGSCP